VSIVSLSQQDLTLLHAKGLTLHLVFMLIPMLFNVDRNRHGEILSKLAQIVDEGKIRPLHVDRYSSLHILRHNVDSRHRIGLTIQTPT
jgi:hypothetical protein